MRLFKMIVEKLQAPDLMQRMFSRFQVDPATPQMSDEQAAQALRGAALRCMGCGKTQSCGQWLESHPAPDAPPAYCRNADLIVARLNADGKTLH